MSPEPSEVSVDELLVMGHLKEFGHHRIERVVEQILLNGGVGRGPRQT